MIKVIKILFQKITKRHQYYMLGKLDGKVEGFTEGLKLARLHHEIWHKK